MIITISGTPGSGKSTIAKMLAARLGYKHYSAGDFMRQMAVERGIALDELTRIALKDRSIDDEIDRRTVMLGKKEDNFVIDSRLGWKFIPNAVKILLTIRQEVAARRVFAQRRPDEKENISLERTKENMQNRLKAETERYRKLYGVDYTDAKNHDFVVDTSDLTPEQIVERIMGFLKDKGKL
ncbi:MAG: cytidylate kinase family protein [Candidatus Woesearchaeota archaeon]